MSENLSNITEKKIPGIRKTIARNMSLSKKEIPHAWMMVEVDATNLFKLREKNKSYFLEKTGIKLSPFPFYVHALAQTLKEFPELNSSWQKDKIIHFNNINLSFAVGVNDLLFVPVIRNADKKSVYEIAVEIDDLARKAAENKLQLEDMTDGTFTINNTGSFGSIASMGIINYPQAAILQVESIVKRPVFVGSSIEPRYLGNLCLSIDHRLLDGVLAGEFLKQLKSYIENMSDDTLL